MTKHSSSADGLHWCYSLEKGSKMSGKTDYPGIDYGMGQTNVDKEAGIRYGVISQNKVSSFALDDFMTDGKDLSYQAWKDDVIAAILSALGDALEDYTYKEMTHEIAERIFDDLDDNDDLQYESNGESSYLLEEDGLTAQLCTDGDIMVLKSEFYTFAQFCSPCAPGAGYLASPCESGPKTYCLGEDWFDQYSPCPYPIYLVKTGELVYSP